MALLAVLSGLASAACRMEAPERAEAEARARETGLRGLVMDDPPPRPDVVLTSADGESFDFRARTDGLLTLLFFGYTHCPDVCPIHMSSLAAVKRDLGRELAERMRVVFVTVDPRRDTPERLRDWLGAFDPEFIGLYGDRAVVDSMQTGLGLAPAMVPDPAEGDYGVGHGSPVVAFTADGRVVRYPFGTRQEDWLHDLPILAGLAEG